MQFRELKEKVEAIGLKEIRADKESYLEAVILQDKMDELTRKLDELLGVPVWPSKGSLSHQIENAIKKYGGIMADQTLYFRNQDNVSVFVMLWPWSDGQHTTVKIIQGC